MAAKKTKKAPTAKQVQDGKRWFLTILLISTVFILGFLIAFFSG